IAVAEPQDARGQTLERDAFPRQMNPPDEPFVVAEHFERRLVGDADVVRIARQRRPAEGTLALAEERSNVLRHEAGNVERVGHASMARTCSAMAAIDRATYSCGWRSRSRVASSNVMPLGT